jgi:Flp pilus assembly protein TadD
MDMDITLLKGDHSMSGNHARVRRLPVSLAAILILGACNGMPGKVGGGGSTSLSLADRAVNAGDYETAVSLYQQAYDANPRSTAALLGLGRGYAGLGQYSRSEKALEEAERRSPHDPDIQLEIARARLAAGNATAALAHLDKVGGKSQRDIEFITARGIALDRLSRHKEAQETYRQGLKIAPTDFALLSNLGLSLGLSGQTAEGIQILSELSRDKQANARTRGNLALVYGLAGREAEAKATLSRDLPSSQVQSNLAYYRELRGFLKQGKPIGSFDQPAGKQPAKAKPAVEVAKAPAAGEPLAATPKPATEAKAPVQAPKSAATTPAIAPAAEAAAPQAAPAAQVAATPTPKPAAPQAAQEIAPLAETPPLVGAFKPASGGVPITDQTTPPLPASPAQ